MAVISHCGVDYTAPTVEVQSDASATSLEATKVPTGQTITSYLNSNLSWTLVNIGTPTSGTLINTSYCYKCAGLKLAIFNIQINGNTAGASIDLGVNVKDGVGDIPIFGWNSYNDRQVACNVSTSTNKLYIKEAAAVVRVYGIVPLD